MYRRPPRPTLFPDTTLCRSEVTDADRREVAEQRRDEPWFAAAYAAFERIWSGGATDADWTAITPFLHGRWDDAARDRKSTRLNSSHANISSAVFCLKKKHSG